MSLLTNQILKTDARHWRQLAYLSISVHFIVILLLSLFRHWGYMSTLNDLGIFDQAVWGLVNGESFLNTIVFDYKVNWLGLHFQPILTLFIPFYAIFPSALWLILVQSVSLSISGVVLFFLARILFKSELISFLWLLSYLMNPTLLNAGVYDFSPMTITVPCILVGMLAVEMKKPRWLIASMLIILLCKEHLGVMVIGFGCLWWVKNREWKVSVLLLCMGIAHMLIVMEGIMPMLSPTKTHIMISEDMGQLSRYGWLGNSPGAIIETIFSRPLFVLKTALLDFKGIQYLGLLLMFFLGLPLAAPEFLFPAMADLAVNLLSYNSLPRSLFAFHNLSIIAILTVASMYGVKRISNLPKRFNRFSVTQLAALVVAVNFIGGYFLGPLPFPGARNIMAPTHLVNWPEATISKIRSITGTNTSVSVQANVGAHFSHRKEVYLYPNQTGKADAIILRMASPTSNINNIPEHLKKERKFLCTALDGHLQMDRTDYLRSIEMLLYNNEYGIVFWNDPWIVFKKGAADVEARDTIFEKIAELKRQWQI
jgi:uncharacterized membrane protein